jgi:hypothetical protein
MLPENDPSSKRPTATTTVGKVVENPRNDVISILDPKYEQKTQQMEESSARNLRQQQLENSFFTIRNLGL